MRTGVWLLAGVMTCGCVGMTAAQNFPTNEQMRHMRRMSEPRLSPDGKRVLLRVTEATADGAASHLWLVDVEGAGEPRQITYAPANDKRGERDGEWMPDGRSVLFLAKRGEHVELFRLPMDGGEAKAFPFKVMPLVDESKRPGAIAVDADAAKKDSGAAAAKVDETPEPAEVDVENFRVSPDGKTIAFLANDPETPGEKKQKDAKADAQWVDHELHGARLYLYDLATEKLTTAGVPVDVRAASWAADSSALVVVREEPNGASEIAPANSAWVVKRDDAGHAERLDGIPATVDTASWSRDGQTIWYVAQAKQDAPPGYADLYRYAVATKASVDVSEGFDGSLRGAEPIALANGEVVEVGERGVEAPVLMFGRGRAVKLPVAVVSSAETNEARSGWVFVGSGGGVRTELLYASSLEAAPRVLKTPKLVPDGVGSTAPKRISWKNEGFTIDGLLYLPPEAKTAKVPLVVDVHGGPLGSHLDADEKLVEFLLGQGWAVLRPNPRGSSGRGAKFAAANKNDLGGGDYRDIMAGVDYVLKTESLDPARTALIGYSYGGEMAGFVETKTTRFKAIVSMAPVIDQNSEYGTERGSWYDQWYFGKPWEHEADAWRQSPLAGAAQAKTPLLLIQGESDSTDPLGQSQEMYRALRQMKVPVELVTYPREDHGPLAIGIFGEPSPEPWHGFDGRQRIVDFLGKAFAGQ